MQFHHWPSISIIKSVERDRLIYDGALSIVVLRTANCIDDCIQPFIVFFVDVGCLFYSSRSFNFLLFLESVHIDISMHVYFFNTKQRGLDHYLSFQIPLLIHQVYVQATEDFKAKNQAQGISPRTCSISLRNFGHGFLPWMSAYAADFDTFACFASCTIDVLAAKNNRQFIPMTDTRFDLSVVEIAFINSFLVLVDIDNQ